jgi:hypothetical protein
MQFVHQSLTWGFMLALIPVVIHLINLVRRRRVQWAAMDFLLQSYRKHRTWIWMQQLLLLLLRMAAIALVVAMLAQWITQREWFSLFGGTATHHYVILDDSYSMSELYAGTSAFDVAEQAIGNLASQAMRQETHQKFTLVRYSRSAAGGSDLSAGQIADLNSEIVDNNFDVFVSDRLREIRVSELATGPQAALRIVQQLLDVGLEDQNRVYLLSDFREREWKSPAEIRQQLQTIAGAGAEIHLINCSDRPQDNLAVADIQPANGTRAAGVPLFIEIRVKNYGRQVARKIPVRVRTHYFDPQVVAASRPGEDIAHLDDPPAALIEEIRPGETATARVQVFFPQPGAHAVEVWLPDDAVEADNRRWCIVDLPESELVLVIDGSLLQRHAYFMASAFEPGQRVVTGIRPDVQPPAFLRDMSTEALRSYRAVYLLDVPRLDATSIERLTEYVREGGGLGFFLGENVNVAFYNDALFAEGEGLLPLPLEREVALPPDRLENAPDFQVQDHPIFSVFLGERNPFITLITIERYFRTAPAPTEGPATTVEVLAQLRNGEPLAVERRLGEGRVVAFMTTAAPVWNNWGNDPSFVVMLLKLQSYLTAPARQLDARLVGSQLEIQFPSEQFAPKAVFVVPDTEDVGGRLVVEQTAEPVAPDEGELVARLSHTDTAPMTNRSGIYEAWLRELTGIATVRRFGLNVDPTEGNLTPSAESLIVEQLAPVSVQFHSADEFTYDFWGQAGSNRSLLLMVVLIGALLSEQLLAYFTSYHPGK